MAIERHSAHGYRIYHTATAKAQTVAIVCRQRHAAPIATRHIHPTTSHQTHPALSWRRHAYHSMGQPPHWQQNCRGRTERHRYGRLHRCVKQHVGTRHETQPHGTHQASCPKPYQSTWRRPSIPCSICRQRLHRNAVNQRLWRHQDVS